MRCKNCSPLNSGDPSVRPRLGNLVVPALLALVTALATPAHAAVLEVPQQYGTIQEAVDAAASGDCIRIDAGVYVEQVDIGKSLTVEGEGADRTVVQAPAVLAAQFTVESVEFRPVIYVHGGAEVSLVDMCIDGAGLGADNLGFTGVAFVDAGGALNDARIVGLCESPVSSADHGTAVYARSTSGAAHTLTVADCEIGAYQEAGLSAHGSGLEVSVRDSWIIGPGEEARLSAPIGIRVADGATALIRDNHIYYNRSRGAGCGSDLLAETQAIGLSLENASPATVVGDNIVAMNDVGLRCAGDASIARVFLLDNRYAGIVLSGGHHSLEEVNTQGDHRVGVAVLGDSGTSTAEVRDCCLSGPGGRAGDEGVIGVWAWGVGADVTVDRCAITQWSVGLKPESALAHLAVKNSVIASNIVAGYDNTQGAGEQQAALNWWGTGAGPEPAAGGDAVRGDGVIYQPIRIEDHDTALTCGLQPRECIVGCVSPTECLSEQGACIEGIPFLINRLNHDPVRSFRVTLTLSEELELCEGTASIHEGTFLGEGFTTEFLVVEVDPRTYEVMGTIVGDPCGATAAGGALFTMDVRSSGLAPGGDGIICTVAAELIGCGGESIEVALGPEVTVAMCDMAAVGEEPGGSLEGGVAGASLLLRARPNPSAGSTQIHLTLPVQEHVSVRVYDTSGRVVRTLHRGPLAAGAHVFSWAGEGDDGRIAAAGVYLCTVRSRTHERSLKVFRYR